MSENVNKKQQADIFDDEKDVLLDHNYDGIRELDNHMPGCGFLDFGSASFLQFYTYSFITF